ncbi:CoA-binding protein [Kockiozyma suomiensis]|uniref:CoA-binding protein n=1 Tax=Kockiozyma suomiensis TaxID=1337062 RepID=UPI00334392A7
MSVEPLRKFFSASQFAVVGASTDTAKFGNKILKWYVDHSLPVTGINPSEPTVYGIKSAASLDALLSQIGSDAPLSVSIVTPPPVSREAVKFLSQVGENRIKGVWLQPGSFDQSTLDAGSDKLNLIAGGRCVLVEGESGLQAVGKL